jgi:hypothetical protein
LLSRFRLGNVLDKEMKNGLAIQSAAQRKRQFMRSGEAMKDHPTRAIQAAARAGSSRQMPGGSSICGLMQINDG